MSISALQAIDAYAQASQTGQAKDIASAVSLAGDTKASSGLDFASMVQDAMGSVTASTAQAEKMVVMGAAGQTELIDVVTAISQAEIQLETVITVRDEMIKAYKDILRMPI
ncbi:MAG: flagellar hook-basal body complex protein FliE [Robiginitomaculum sp.]|nr:flagellar hook-basal body complex protein FliE [Robiginitomaculum sp.]